MTEPASRERVLFVLAGNHAQAEYHARDAGLKPSQWHYLFDATPLLGTRKPRVWMVGHWSEHPGVAEIRREMRARDAINMTVAMVQALDGETR